MTNDFDAFVDNLQKEIFDEAKDVLGEEGFQRWRHPKYCGRMKACDSHARITGICGDTMEIFLKFKNSLVLNASYWTDGCSTSSVCGSFAAELSLGKNYDELIEITGEKILKKLGNLSQKEKHCAFLAAETLHEALNQYMIQQTK